MYRNITYTLGFVVGLLLVYVEITRSREKKESFIESTRLYKTTTQALRKCKRDTTRYANKKIDGVRTEIKRMIRKKKL